jgi:hypothetical protein
VLVLSKEAGEQHRDAEVRQLRKEADKQVQQYASSVKHPGSTSRAVILVGSVASPSRKPPEEEEVGVTNGKVQ